MRALSFAALIVGVILIPTALGVAKQDHDHRVSELNRALIAETDEHGGALESYFDRARTVLLLTANSHSFRGVLAEPGTRAEKVRRQSDELLEVTRNLVYLEQLYPGSIGEASFIDADGGELARVVHGKIPPRADLSTVEENTGFFAPTFGLPIGQIHQTRPYVSQDTKEWVVGNATRIPQADGRKGAIVHFEVTVDSFRRALGATSQSELRVIDGHTGRVIIDGARAQRIGAPLGAPDDRRFAGVALSEDRGGLTEVDGRRAAFRHVTPTLGNANDWIVVASATAPTGSFISGMGPVPIAMLAAALVIVTLAGLSLRATGLELRAHASTDGLTGLGNRRKLLADLARTVRSASVDEPVVLTMFDLNGFKNYNDTFGHPAGDALLLRLGHALREASGRSPVGPTGREVTSSASSATPPISTRWSRPPAARSRSRGRGSRSCPRSGPS
jgi:hypothetical protein